MDNFHREILSEIKKYAEKRTSYSWSIAYLGSGHFYYALSVPNKRLIAKTWAKNNSNIELSAFIDLLDSLYRGESYEEKTIASELLEYLPKLRQQINPRKLDDWLDYLQGWAEVDALCQSVFTLNEMNKHWREWSGLAKQFSKNLNVNKRRAALVLLTGPVASSNESKFAQLAIDLIDTLKQEQQILITKAISWLLRSLVRNHKARVAEYLKTNKDSLPRIVIRETRNKLNQ